MLSSARISAASSISSKRLTEIFDGKEKPLTIFSFKEPIGRWDMAGLNQTALVKNASLGIEFTHTHHPEGNIANGKAYFQAF